MNTVAAKPLSLERRFAIRLLHAAQTSGETPFVAVVGAALEPDTFITLASGAVLDEGLAALAERKRAPWAVYLHRPGRPTAPEPQDFAEQPALLRLTASLATKGVLQLRAWALDTEGRVHEHVLALTD